MLTQEQKDMYYREALAQAQRASQKVVLANITAGSEGDSWPVRVEARANEYFTASGRMSGINFYLSETTGGYLVAVTNYNRAGLVPADCSVYDIMDYVGMENEVDAATLAAAVRYLISAGYACSYPSLSMLTENPGD